ncbi:MAG: hypothetical protein KIS94_08975 [Chitinophagales bacterium]|nr:hypothetical protein [Chitinophagales bacterium]
MELTKVRNRFHQMIDEVENQDMLLMFFELFKWRVSEPDSGLWKSLTPKEKAALVKAYKESETEANLVSEVVVKRKYSKWLKP